MIFLGCTGLTKTIKYYNLQLIKKCDIFNFKKVDQIDGFKIYFSLQVDFIEPVDNFLCINKIVHKQ
jgi:hypothetical protein